MTTTINPTLGQKQRQFVRSIAKLLNWGLTQGYEFTFGETLRRQTIAEQNAKSGKGIANSLHLHSLAIDLNLFIDGVYQTGSDSHAKLGEYWKSLDTPGYPHYWGGDFKSNPDGNHYSIGHFGLK